MPKQICTCTLNLYTVCIGRIGLVVFCIGSEGIKDHDTIKQLQRSPVIIQDTHTKKQKQIDPGYKADNTEIKLSELVIVV